MPEETKKASEELVNVGETVGADIDFDDKGEPVKQEEVVEEKIEVEEVSDVDKTYENERETKLEKKEDKDELKAANRRKSYCARSLGQLKRSSAKTRNDPNSRIRQARRRWKC